MRMSSRVGVLAARETDHDAIACLDHPEVLNGLVDNAPEPLSELVSIDPLLGGERTVQVTGIAGLRCAGIAGWSFGTRSRSAVMAAYAGSSLGMRPRGLMVERRAGDQRCEDRFPGRPGACETLAAPSPQYLTMVRPAVDARRAEPYGAHAGTEHE
jgi:hypothetical protein